MNIRQAVDNSAINFSKNTYLQTTDGLQLSFADLQKKVRALSAFFRSHNILKTDVVLLLAPDSIPSVVFTLSAMYYGATILPLDPALMPLLLVGYPARKVVPCMFAVTASMLPSRASG